METGKKNGDCFLKAIIGAVILAVGLTIFDGKGTKEDYNDTIRNVQTE